MRADGVGISARIVSASEAVGTINLEPCPLHELDRDPQHPRRERASGLLKPRDDRVGGHAVVLPDLQVVVRRRDLRIDDAEVIEP